MPAAVPAIRSALFVPAHRTDMLDKAARFGTDALIADLEDSVPSNQKDAACESLRAWLASRPAGGPVIVVRINSLDTGRLVADLAAAASPPVTCVMVPKLQGRDELEQVLDALSASEQRLGRPVGSTLVWPLAETANAVRNAYEIATASERIAYMGGSAGDAGDLAQSIGFQWSADFSETFFIRSKVLVDVRAAGIANPMTGVVTNLSSLDEVERFAQESRGLGYEGMMVIHPSHVAIVNRVFSPSADRLAWARSVLVAIDQAEAAGLGATTHEGRMVDIAMVATARSMLAHAPQHENG
jgi:citrate lyase subunit beta/citryl-CoA lyase